uniref:Uncharacterized protein n=1 Tax=Rhizophora mucronata TaxID=61149 RepID=A0A2P2Q928_RHIMU
MGKSLKVDLLSLKLMVSLTPNLNLLKKQLLLLV